ncbi:MAG: hypothetical protein AAF849_01080 [Bacteroidota bacterium]
MQHKFSPSINIIRDSYSTQYYLPTNNGKNVFQQIASNFKTGLHSYNIIGSYGTGKSAFLLAFMQQLEGRVDYFGKVNGQFNDCSQFKFYKVVGFSGSFIATIAEQFNVEPDSKAILTALQKEHKKLKAKGICLVILVDEFGKFLEYAAQNSPESEMYFIQQLAEFANDARRNLLFLTTLHQNFDAYAVGLQDTQRQEWEKVKGRLKELTFNEPVEQLLRLASNFLVKHTQLERPESNPQLLKTIQRTGIFSLLNDDTHESLANKLYPFDLLSAMTMTLSLQRYGQNERSLFHFLQTDEHLGINQFTPNESTPYYNLAKVYDYLIYNYYSTLTSKHNPDYFKWNMIRHSLERVEVELSEQYISAALKLVKTVGLLDILGPQGAKIDNDLISQYALHCLGIEDAIQIINKLEDKQIIKYLSFRNRFKLFEGTDVDIEAIQEEARKNLIPITNLALELSPFFKLDFVSAKAVSYQKGTPRLFEFKLSEEAIIEFEASSSEIDGFINLLFEQDEHIESIQNEPILYGVFGNTNTIRAYLLDIKTIEKALQLIHNDKIAKRELIDLKNSQIAALNKSLNDELFGQNAEIKWYYNRQEITIESRRKFNQTLSQIVNDIYPDTPTYRNELMNKTKVSSSIHLAKKNYISALLNNWNKPNLGFESTKFPPERTIYISLLKETGIHFEPNSFTANFQPPSDESFTALWNASWQFLESAKTSKRKLTEFIDLLSQKPFKLKYGFLEFWIISFLFINREEFSLFNEGRYIPYINDEVAFILIRDAKKYEIKTFDIAGVKLDLFNKYRELTQQATQEKATASSFQATARPFLVFHKQLPQYTQQTKSVSHSTLAFREKIATAKELEKTFFEDIPTCFGVSLEQLSQSEEVLEQFVNQVQSSITELRTAYNKLIDKVEIRLLEVLGMKANTDFETYKKKIQKRYKSIKKYLLFDRQKTFHNRLQSKLDDRKAWLNSVAQALMGKQLSTFKDGEVPLLKERLGVAIRELDDLTELSALKHDESTEEALKIEITGFDKQAIKRNLILSKQQQKAVQQLETNVRAILKDSDDTQSKQAVLIRLLRELIQDDKS